jgi:hypothetical protein
LVERAGFYRMTGSTVWWASRDALDFYEAREREVCAATFNRSRTFSREALARHPHPFWKGRAGDPEVDPIDPHDDASILSGLEVGVGSTQERRAILSRAPLNTGLQRQTCRCR